MRLYTSINKLIQKIIDRNLVFLCAGISWLIIFIRLYFNNNNFVTEGLLFIYVFSVFWQLIAIVVVHGIYWLFGRKRVPFKPMFLKFLIYSSLHSILFGLILACVKDVFVLSQLISVVSNLFSLWFYSMVFYHEYNATKTTVIVLAVIYLFGSYCKDVAELIQRI